MPADYMLMTVDDLPEDDSRSPSPDQLSPPQRRRSSQTRASAARRSSVTVACERCRRRKIRCSGLPGPCTSCAKFNVSCLDPGKRKQRSSSFLEDRIRRLEALAASGLQIDPTTLQDLKAGVDDIMDSSDGEHAFPKTLQIDTTNLNQWHSTEDPGFYSTKTFDSDIWSRPYTPGAHSDILPDVDGFWGSSSLQHDEFENSQSVMSSINALHKRAQTFPIVPLHQHTTSYDEPLLSPSYSEIPSIQITSHDGSRSPSPSSYPTDPTALALPIRATLPTYSANLAQPAPQAIQTTPLLADSFNDSNMDYYAQYLSPLDHPPTLSRRPSVSASTTKPGMSNVSEWSSRVSSPSSSIIADPRPKRRHTTCSISRSISNATTQLLSPELSWMLSSPRTTNYLTRYFSTVHLQYPFLDRSEVLPHASSTTTLDMYTVEYSNPIKMYTRLLTAGIGALVQHESRDISARYVRHAVALATDSDFETTMWSSISGIHAAMLLAIYCLLENTTTFENEDEDTTHPEINLWLWNCRIAASCIDLGLHVYPSPSSRKDLHQSRRKKDVYDLYDSAAGGRNGGGMKIFSPEFDSEEEGSEHEDTQLTDLYKNTFRSAYLLDKRISEVRKRPRAIHDGDVDIRLIKDLI